MSMLSNITITVTGSAQLYGNLLCTPAAWTDILTFYLANYVTHIATVQSYPGEHSIDKWLQLFAALLMPAAGIGKGLDRLFRCAVRGKTTLEKAARAGALCMIVRDTDWQPYDSQVLVDTACCSSQHLQHPAEVRDSIGEAMGKPPKTMVRHEHRTWSTKLRDAYFHGSFHSLSIRLKTPLIRFEYHNKDQVKVRSATLRVYNAQWQRESSHWWEYLGIDVANIASGRKTHGTVQHTSLEGLQDGLPAGYKLAFVPHSACIESLGDDVTWTSTASKAYASEDDINSSYDLVAAVASVVQLLFGLSTLYSSVGPQLSRFGYAAFGLTVIQYSLVSLINLLATIVTPSYAAIYLVESEIMDEAIFRGARIKGVIGRLLSDHTHADELLSPGSSCTLVARVDQGDDLVTDQKETKDHDGANKMQTTSSTYSIKHEPDVTAGVKRDESHLQQILVCTLSGLDATRLSRSHIGVDGGGEQHENDVIYVPSHPQYERYGAAYSGAPADVEWMTALIITVVGLLPLIPIGVLTHFKAGDSTYGQRVIVMLWLAMSAFYGTIGAQTSTTSSSLTFDAPAKTDESTAEEASRSTETSQGSLPSIWQSRLVWGLTLLLVSAPGIAGLVVAGMMFASFGTCTTIS